MLNVIHIIGVQEGLYAAFGVATSYKARISKTEGCVIGVSGSIAQRIIYQCFKECLRKKGCCWEGRQTITQMAAITITALIIGGISYIRNHRTANARDE